MGQPEVWQVVIAVLTGAIALTRARPPKQTREGALVTVRPDRRHTEIERR